MVLKKIEWKMFFRCEVCDAEFRPGAGKSITLWYRLGDEKLFCHPECKIAPEYVVTKAERLAEVHRFEDWRASEEGVAYRRGERDAVTTDANGYKSYLPPGRVQNIIGSVEWATGTPQWWKDWLYHNDLRAEGCKRVGHMEGHRCDKCKTSIEEVFAEAGVA